MVASRSHYNKLKTKYVSSRAKEDTIILILLFRQCQSMSHKNVGKPSIKVAASCFQSIDFYFECFLRREFRKKEFAMTPG